MIEQLLIHGILVFMSLFEFFMSLQQTFVMDSKSMIAHSDSKETLPLWGLPSGEVVSLVIGNAIVEKAYVESKTTEEHTVFLASLLIEDCSEPQNPLTYTDEEHQDMLTMDQWQAEPTPVSVKKQLAATASAKISDLVLGEQLWVVEVVGEEQGYAHVSDGSARAWVDVASFGTVMKGDILSILIERSQDLRVRSLDVDILQRRSMEFELLDEIESEVHEDRELALA